MNLDELLDKLDAESPQELVYFEQFADLMEEQNDVPYETLAALAVEMDSDVLSGLIDSYFEDILKSVPDGEDELYILLTNICTTLQALAKGIGGEDDDAARLFAEELYKFRAWYLFEELVFCTDLSEGEQHEISLFEALTNYRVQSHTGEDFAFDFSDALDYQLDEYIVSLASIIEDNYGDGDSYGEDDDYRDPDSDE